MKNKYNYSNLVPNIIINIPIYWNWLRFSPKSIDDIIALKSGVKDNRGIVKLSSEISNDFKKSNAEKTLIIIKSKPGTRYSWNCI